MSFVARNHQQQVAVRGPLDEVDDRGTPPELFNSLNDHYGPFTLDVAAAAHNAKCEAFYTRSDDGLQQPWTGVVWCNPPYSDLNPWLRKAWSEWRSRSGHLVRIVMLVPANRTEQAWWQDYVEPYRDGPVYPFRTRFLKGRTRFIKPGQTEIGANERPPFGCALLLWGCHAESK